MTYAKRHETCILFLEQGFGTEENPQKLKDAGFDVVCFAESFPHEAAKNITVSDPCIIKHCDQKDYVLVTFDKGMKHTHIKLIRQTGIAIIATESADKFTPSEWTCALLKAGALVRRKVRKFPRPWFGHLMITGTLRKVQTITPDMDTRRTRPQEQ